LGAVAALSRVTPGQDEQISLMTYAEANGAESAGSSLGGSSVTASSDDTFLEDDGHLIDIDGSASCSTPFISVFPEVRRGSES
jgi:hypothetical protein